MIFVFKYEVLFRKIEMQYSCNESWSYIWNSESGRGIKVDEWKKIEHKLLTDMLNYI